MGCAFLCRPHVTLCHQGGQFCVICLGPWGNVWFFPTQTARVRVVSSPLFLLPPAQPLCPSTVLPGTHPNWCSDPKQPGLVALVATHQVESCFQQASLVRQLWTRAVAQTPNVSNCQHCQTQVQLAGVLTPARQCCKLGIRHAGPVNIHEHLLHPWWHWHGPLWCRGVLLITRWLKRAAICVLFCVLFWWIAFMVACGVGITLSLIGLVLLGFRFWLWRFARLPLIFSRVPNVFAK